MEGEATHRAICVLTARGLGKILEDGGSQAWVLDARRARRYEYVVCVQNRGFAKDWGQASAPHHAAFLVGRLKRVVPCEEPGSEHRWLLVFSEYAEINLPNAWPGYRNPVLYTDLESLGIDVSSLDFRPMPEQAAEAEAEPQKKIRPLTIAEAKEGLALTFKVEPSAIEIMIRG